MASEFARLLQATIQHLESLRDRGVRHVPVAPETLAALARPVPPRRPVAAATRVSPMAVPTAATPARPSTSKAPSPPGRPLSEGDKAARLRSLAGRVRQCTRCPHLASSRTQTVFGVGNIDAALMFVGEAPGADEDAQGEPFVGRAGQLLTRIIETMGLRREDVYIANILKCRPDTPGQRSGNRKPTVTEMATCLPYLIEQIQVIRPRVLVALGMTAVEGLLGKQVAGTAMSKLRGRWLEWNGLPLMPTYHPAFLLRNQSITMKRLVWEDMLQVMEKLGLPISEKQRRYFQKPR